MKPWHFGLTDFALGCKWIEWSWFLFNNNDFGSCNMFSYLEINCNIDERTGLAICEVFTAATKH